MVQHAYKPSTQEAGQGQGQEVRVGLGCTATSRAAGVTRESEPTKPTGNAQCLAMQPSLKVLD